MILQSPAGARRAAAGVLALLTVAVGIALPAHSIEWGAAVPKMVAQASPKHLTAFSAATAPEGFAGVCQRYGWACSNKGSPGLGEKQILAAAQRVNATVNRTIRPMTDSAQYGVADYWTLPYSGRGDCEDYALLKKKKLIEAGVPSNRLFLATAFNRQNEHHVVLVLRVAQADLVLDNLVSSIKPWQATGYSYVKMQNPQNKGRWDAILLGPSAFRSPAS